MCSTHGTRIRTTAIIFGLLIAHGNAYLAGVAFAAIFAGVLLPAVWSGNPARRTAAAYIIRVLLSPETHEGQRHSKTDSESRD